MTRVGREHAMTHDNERRDSKFAALTHADNDSLAIRINMKRRRKNICVSR